VETEVAWWFKDTVYAKSIHIGEDVQGGVFYANGTFYNQTTREDGTDNFITVGDGFRVDGPIVRGLTGVGDGRDLANDNLPIWMGDDAKFMGQQWGGDYKGTDRDGKAFEVADSVYPAMDNINSLGSANFRWYDLYLSNQLQSDGAVDEPDLEAVDTPAVGEVLAYDGNDRFRWDAMPSGGGSEIVYYQVLTEPDPNPHQDNCVATGRVEAIYHTTEATVQVYTVNLNSDTSSAQPCNYTNTNTYTVTATYDVSSNPYAPGVGGNTSEIFVRKISGTVFEVIMFATATSNPPDLAIDWQAEGY
jgi:hypothetical protein